MTNDYDNRPWYRQFWLWVVLAPLITVVCVSAVTVSIAFRHADDVVIDNYYKQGRMINQSMEQDRKALEYNLSANLRFDQTTGEVFLRIPTHDSVPQQLLLLLDHPFEADLDQQIVLQQVSAGQYRGELERELSYAWYLALMPELNKARRREAQWLLSGEINFQAGDETELKPRALISR